MYLTIIIEYSFDWSSIDSCTSCDATFKRKCDRNQHMLSLHPDENAKAVGMFSCGHCSKKFATLTVLNRHKINHLPDDLRLVHPCRFCDKRFSQFANMQVHVRMVHTRDWRYICEECGKGFVTNVALKEHKSVHSNEFPFQCALCPKKFKNVRGLKVSSE